MKTHDFYYDLPEELIAQTPLEQRDASRLLTLDRLTGEIGHHHFYDLVDYLHPGDCLVLNNSRVLPARLLGHRVPTMGAVEVLLLKDRGNGIWECLTKPGRKTKPGTELSFGEGALTATVTDALETGNDPISLRGNLFGGPGAAGKNAPAAVYQGGAARRRAVSDGVFQDQRLCGGAYGGSCRPLG